MKKKRTRANFDSTWKEALRLYFKQFMALCWKEAFEEIDWEKGYELLNVELESTLKDADIGKRIPDKLMKVWRNNGTEACIVVHIEVEGNNQRCDFAERMYIYRYRIFERYPMPIASLAILIDKEPNWRPDVYHTDIWGSVTTIKFPILKVWDYRSQREALEASGNPFAWVLLAQLEAMEHSKNVEGRLVGKVALTRKLLHTHGLTPDDILSLYRFLDWLLKLPKTLAIQYHREVKQIEEELQVNYITTAERIGMEQGIKQGMQKGIHRGESTLLMSLLKYKFGSSIPHAYLSRIDAADEQTLLLWGQRCLNASALEEVFLERP